MKECVKPQSIQPFARGALGLIAVGAIGLTSLTYAAQATRDARVDLNGHQVHVQEGGVAAPAVIFESGLGEDLSTWSSVQPEVVSFAHTFTYDRPGLGTSEPSPVPRDLTKMAGELHSLLVAVKVGPPYVLVGHSLAGAIVQIFANLYSSDVAGVVLVDPEDGRLDGLLRSNMSAPDWESRQKAIDQTLPTMPAAVRAELEAYKKSADYPDDVFVLQKMPVVLLTGTKKNPEFPGNPLEQDLKLGMHRSLLARLPTSQHVLVPNSRHYIQKDAPEQVVEAIRSVISRAVPVAASSAHRHK